MKTFLTGTVLTFVVLTFVPALFPATDYVYLYGYPRYFYKYESMVSATSDYQSHVFMPLSLLIDMGFAALAGAAIFAVLRVRRKTKVT